MSKFGRKVKRTGKVVSWLIVIVSIALAVGFAAYFSNGFTAEIKTFFVTLDGRDYLRDTQGLVFDRDRTLRCDVKYTFGWLNPKGDRSFAVKIVPGDADFDFLLDGKLASFGAERDLSAGFDLEIDATGFALAWPRGWDMAEILGAVYPGHTIGDVPDYRDLYHADYFALLVSSADGSKQVRLSFCSAPIVTGLEGDKPEIIL